MNVPLEHAMLCWDTDTNSAEVVQHPDVMRLSDRYRFSGTAAYVSKWPKLDKTEKLLLLYITAWQAIVRDGIDPNIMHNALVAIPEFRRTLASDVEGAEE